ncbi:MAG: hypothetical protein KUG61_04215 [Parvibaculaceae bacterium]|nr:hypothetical protein [Parvibaculaceae bacterium]
MAQHPDHTTLMIGATGMLAPALVQAASHSTHLLSLARHASQFTLPPTRPADTYNGHDVDYEDIQKVEHLLTTHGPFDTALTWIRPKALDLRDLIAQNIKTGGHLIEVMGSAASRPGALAEQRRAAMTALPNVNYSQLILGFIPATSEATVSRWLTHAEISAAACRLLKTPAPRTIVGQVEPWDMRPL